MHILYCCRTNS